MSSVKSKNLGEPPTLSVMYYIGETMLMEFDYELECKK